MGVLQEVAGPCYPMLFLKMGAPSWTPVGEEMLQQLIPGKNDTSAVVLCDSEGNAKTMSAWHPNTKAEELSRTLLAKGVHVFDGEVKLPI